MNDLDSPSWFDRLTMRAAGLRNSPEVLILSLLKDEDRARN